jgi:hypothetical protein
MSVAYAAPSAPPPIGPPEFPSWPHPPLQEVRPTTPPLRLLDRIRQAIETRHYSRRTTKAYVGWIKRYIFFHHKRHPAEMGLPR